MLWDYYSSHLFVYQTKQNKKIHNFILSGDLQICNMTLKLLELLISEISFELQQ